MFSIAGGDDSDLFTVNPNNGALKFIHAPDFENPQDSNGNNVYEVVVAATDSHGAVSQQAIDVTVTDVRERDKMVSASHNNDGHDAFVFNKSFGNGTVTNLSHQEMNGIDHDLFAKVQELVEAAHKIVDHALTDADAVHGLPQDHFQSHQHNAHDFLS